ncbi:hypothetical protein [Leptolyngbya iicbica]|uniref:Uncharacterized protein n=2 Tax=Cyanophyceae TaxID=3028117 RepID=A0A4Q7EBK2_9CYAN|nr:hypothetical protein [Leptolyngbya sp. LK]RZM78595.1 hypothetical protein DYY88_07230 [Leptolyngbya sp. LK]
MSTALMNGHRNGHQTPANSWSTLSVREFFEQMPWTGMPVNRPSPTAGSSSADATGANGLSLTLSVGEYFNLFPWDGKPNIAVPVAPLDIQPDLPMEDDITLDGFADLF